MKSKRTPPPRRIPQREPEQWDLEQIAAHWGSYAEYSRTLRAWLVAYGIGGPLLLFTNETLSTRFAASSYAKEIVIWFLSGVALQILLAFVNKWSGWHTYSALYDEELLKKRRYICWTWVHGQDWFDLVLDVASIVCFVVATYLAFVVMFTPAIIAKP